MSPQVFHPRPVPAWIFSVTALVMAGIAGFTGQTSAWLAAAFMGLAAAVIFTLFSRTELTLDVTGLLFRSPFVKRQLWWQEVRQSYTRFERRGKYRRLVWYFETVDGNQVALPLHFFARRDLRFLAETVAGSCRQAAVSDEILDMAQGRFSWRLLW